MSRFTFFTSLLAAVVILIVVQLVLRDYFPQNAQTSVVSQDYLAPQAAPQTDTAVDTSVPPAEDIAPTDSGSTDGTPLNPGKFLTKKTLSDAGLQDTGQVSSSLKVFQLFDMSPYAPSSRASFEAQESGSPIGIFSEWEYPDEISAKEAMDIIQNKSKVYVDLSVNMTNSFGDASFYLNHQKKPGEAFLVIRMRNFLYTFAYVKTYHASVMALISSMYTDILDQPKN